MATSKLSRKIHLFLGIASLVIAVIFTLQNTEVVAVNFLWWKLELSRVILILIMLLLGFLIGYIVRGLNR